MTLNDFLVFLGGVGGVAAVSWVLEYFGLFQNLEAKQKQLVYFLLCVVVALSAYGIKTYVPVEILDQIEPFFEIVAVIFAYQFLGTKYHYATKLQK